MSQIITSVLIFLGMLTVTSIAGALIASYAVKPQTRLALRPMAQPLLTVVGMMFSVLLGFFIAQAMRNYAETNNSTTQEANALGEVFRLASGLNDTDRKRIRTACRKYAEIVVNEEWPLMAASQDSDKAWDSFQDLWDCVISAQPSCQRTGCVYETLMTAMDNLGRYRRARIAVANVGQVLHLWVIIACGAGAIITVTFLFAPESKSFHAIAISCIVLPLTLNAYLLSEYTYPFSGPLGIKPTMFNLLQERLFKQSDIAPKYLQD